MHRISHARLVPVALSAALGVLAVACAEDPSKKVPAAQVAESARAKVTEQAAEGAAKPAEGEIGRAHV